MFGLITFAVQPTEILSHMSFSLQFFYVHFQLYFAASVYMLGLLHLCLALSSIVVVQIGWQL